MKPGNGLRSQNVTDNNILRLREILSIFPGIKTADVYVMWAVTNRNVCFIPERGNHQIPLCHQNGKITMDTAQFSVFVCSAVIKPPGLLNCGCRIQTVLYSCRLWQVTSVSKPCAFNYYCWISGLSPMCGVLYTKFQDTKFVYIFREKKLCHQVSNFVYRTVFQTEHEVSENESVFILGRD